MTQHENEQGHRAPTLIILKPCKHVSVRDIPKSTDAWRAIKRGGIRTGPGRSIHQAQALLDKVPAAHRQNIDELTAYFKGRDCSHIVAHANGGSAKANNMAGWELAKINRGRKGNMTELEHFRLKITHLVENTEKSVRTGTFMGSSVCKIVGASTCEIFMSGLEELVEVFKGRSVLAAIRNIVESVLQKGANGFMASALFSAATTASVVLVKAMCTVMVAAGPILLVFNVLRIVRRGLMAFQARPDKELLLNLDILGNEFADEGQYDTFFNDTSDFGNESEYDISDDFNSASQL